MDKLLEEVLNIVRNAGQEILKIYSGEYDIYNKKDKSLLTAADLISNKIITRGLKKYKWPVISEESYDKINNNNKFWIIDPLDGTMDFVQKTGEFSIMVALVENGNPILGTIYQPSKDKMYYAQYNKGAYLKSGGSFKKLQVSKIKKLAECRIVFSRNHLGLHDIQLAKIMGIKTVLKSGSNGIKIGLIAENKADIFFNLTDKMGKWDSCAPEIILKEAGGELTNKIGNRIKYDDGRMGNKHGILASNKVVHNKIIDYLKQNV